MADGYTHSWQESDQWWGMIGCGCGDGSQLKMSVCVCARGGINEPMWGLNTGGLTTAERSQGGVDPHCIHIHTQALFVQLLNTHIHTQVPFLHTAG